MGTPTRVRHYVSQRAAAAANSTEQSEETNTKQTSNRSSDIASLKSSLQKDVFFTSPNSPSSPSIDEKHSSPASAAAVSSSTSANNNAITAATTSSRRSFAITPIGHPIALNKPSLTSAPHIRTTTTSETENLDSTLHSASASGSVSTSSPSGHPSTAYTEKKSGENTVSYASVLASPKKKKVNDDLSSTSQSSSSSSEVKNQLSSKDEKDGGKEPSSQGTIGRKIINTSSSSFSSSHLFDGSPSKVSESSETDPFRASFNQSMKQNDLGNKQSPHWISSASSSSSPYSKEPTSQQQQSSPVSSTPAKTAISHSQWIGYPSSIASVNHPTTPAWTGSPAYFNSPPPFNNINYSKKSSIGQGEEVGSAMHQSSASSSPSSPFGTAFLHTSGSPSISSSGRPLRGVETNFFSSPSSSSLSPLKNVESRFKTSSTIIDNNDINNNDHSNGNSSIFNHSSVNWNAPSFDNSHSRSFTTNSTNTNGSSISNFNNEGNSSISSFDPSYHNNRSAGNNTVDTSISSIHKDTISSFHDLLHHDSNLNNEIGKDISTNFHGIPRQFSSSSIDIDTPDDQEDDDNDGSLYSFNGLADFSSRSFGIDSNRLRGNDLFNDSGSDGISRANNGIVPRLSSISDLNLDDLDNYQNKNTSNNNHKNNINTTDYDSNIALGNVQQKGKMRGDGQLILGLKEESDLDKLYFSLQNNVRNDIKPSSFPTSSSLLNPSQDIFSFSPSKSSIVVSNNTTYVSTADSSIRISRHDNENVNFPNSVKDAYRNIKLNNEEDQTRYLFVSGLPLPDDGDEGNGEEPGQMLVNEITEAIKIYGQLKGIYVRHLIYTGCLILSFNDYRHSNTTRLNLLRDSVKNPTWGYRSLKVDFIEREEVIKLAEGKFTTPFLSLGEGKLTLSASTSFQYEGLKAYFQALGDVKQFTSLDPTLINVENGNGRKRTYFIEYFDDRCASRAWLDITQAENADLQIGWFDSTLLDAHLVENLVSPQTIHSSKQTRPALPPSFPSYPDDRITRYKKTATNWSELSNTPSPAASPLPEGFQSGTTSSSPTSALAGDSTSSTTGVSRGNFNSNGRGGNTSTSSSSMAHLGYVPNDPSRNSTAQWGLIRDDPVPDNNLIRFDRIMSGEDKRTSCILRNLPNRMTQIELMANLDEVVPREYDFLYLRFDFNTGSNCSFSFVNFTSSDALLRFWRARLGTFWDQSNSRKLCMGGMAAIQGKAALIERFRNSSVMDAKEEYRPRIFYSSGPMKGLPEPFPPSNNAMRKARSAHATGIYGLYGKRPSGGFKHVLL